MSEMSELWAHCEGYTALAAVNTCARPERAPHVPTSFEDGGRAVCARCQGLRGWERLLGLLKAQLTNP